MLLASTTTICDMGMEVIVFDDGRVVGPYEADAAVILDRYVRVVPCARGRVCELISPETALLTVEHVLRSI